MSDAANRYRRLSTEFADCIAAVPPDRWSSPSPCEDWTALELVQHVVDTQSLFLGLVGREPTGAPPAADDPAAAWRAASVVIQADLDDPERAGVNAVAGFGDALRTPGVCGPEVEAAADAGPSVRMLAFLGRTP